MIEMNKNLDDSIKLVALSCVMESNEDLERDTNNRIVLVKIPIRRDSSNIVKDLADSFDMDKLKYLKPDEKLLSNIKSYENVSEMTYNPNDKNQHNSSTEFINSILDEYNQDDYELIIVR